MAIKKLTPAEWHKKHQSPIKDSQYATISLSVQEMSLIADAMERMEKSKDSGWDRNPMRSIKCAMIGNRATTLGKGQELLKDKKYRRECYAKQKLKKDYPLGTEFY